MLRTHTRGWGSPSGPAWPAGTSRRPGRSTRSAYGRASMVELRPHPLFGWIPAELRDVLLDFHWDRERLWAMEIEPTEVDIDELAWQLDLPFWSDGERFF